MVRTLIENNNYILHINSYLICSSLYINLFEKISSRFFNQYVLTPYNKKRFTPFNYEIENVNFDFDPYLYFKDRVLFKSKIQKGFKIFLEKKNTDFDFIHAHTLFSDGALAYEIWKSKGIPYSVTIRNTDFNFFWKYFFFLRGYAEDILNGSSRVIFLNNAYRKRFLSKLSTKTLSNIQNKISVIPNGIDDFWHKNNELSKNEYENEVIKALFVGSFYKNKNLNNIIKSCEILRSDHRVELVLVGAKKNEDYRYKNEWIDVLPHCQDKNLLKEKYQWADVFVMPSFRESFGLVYAEALSQGTPVIYTKGQGFDGWVEEGVCGYGVDPNDPLDIADKILKLKNNFDINQCVEASKQFDWNRIADEYIKIYENR
jgi:glycosyltransferase involved in cell wall biosynthesis